MYKWSFKNCWQNKKKVNQSLKLEKDNKLLGFDWFVEILVY